MRLLRLVLALAPLWLAAQAATAYGVLRFGLTGEAALVALCAFMAALALSLLAVFYYERGQRRRLSALGEAVGNGPIGRAGQIAYVQGLVANLCQRLERALHFMAGFEQLDHPALLVDGGGRIVKMTSGLAALAPECAERDTAEALLGVALPAQGEPAPTVVLNGRELVVRVTPLAADRALVDLSRPGLVVPRAAIGGLAEALAGGGFAYRFPDHLAKDAPELAELNAALDAVAGDVAALESLAAGDTAIARGRNGGIGPQIAAMADMMEALRDAFGDEKDQRARAEARLKAIAELVGSCRDSALRISDSAAFVQTQAQAVREALSAGMGAAEGMADIGRDAAGQAAQARNAALEAAGRMAGIDRVAREIDTLVAGIEDVAFRTNLLALNAAVEAARAGDKGAGFAVVASEVRDLAQNSAKTSKSIRQLIKQGLAETGAGREGAEVLSSLLGEVEGHLLNLSGETAKIGDALERGAGALDAAEAGLSGLGRDAAAQANSLAQAPADGERRAAGPR